MNAHPAWSDEQIHAFVDGQLDAGSAARLEADSRVDAALAARIARQRDLQQRLRARFDPVLDEPVPQRLRDSAQAGPVGVVTPIGAARPARAKGADPARPRWSMREWGAIAASVAAGALLAPLFLRDSADLPIEVRNGRLLASGVLDTALSGEISGQDQAAAPVRITLTVRSASGSLCRAFTLADQGAGLACRRDGRWAVQLLDGSAASIPSEQYRQAGSGLSPALLDAINALNAGDPLSEDEERQQVEQGWDRLPP